MPRKKQLTGRYRHRKHWWGWRVEVEHYVMVTEWCDIHGQDHLPLSRVAAIWSKATVQDLLDLGFINVR
jgi:hypothetical protein